MITRFAPSPTGPLHLGHAYSALVAHDRARAAGGDFLLRIEDIDASRARSEWEEAIHVDLAWLGLDWPSPAMRQSRRMTAYAEALDRLWTEGLLYPCSCRRADIKAAAVAPQEGGEPVTGPDGLVYPGTCRGSPRTGPRPDTHLRLDMAAAVKRLPPLSFMETGRGPNGETGVIPLDPLQLKSGVGDVALARRDIGTSYHLSVVVDDAVQGVTEVTRGRDLFDATPIHRILQELLGLDAPAYHHHRLIRDDAGKRLAKRDDARALRTYRERGLDPADVMRMVGFTPLAA